MSGMTTIATVDAVRNQDPIDQLNCRKLQILSYVASCTPLSDLLMYCALEPTFDVFRHCYLRARYRWSYPARYVNDEDLALLGFEVIHIPQWDLADFRRDLPGIVAGGHPVFMHAPRGHFGYWAEFMARVNVPPAEHFELHSFMVCGTDTASGDLLVLDNPNSTHRFQRYTLSAGELSKAFADDPDRCLVSNVILVRRRPEPDIDRIIERYTRFVADIDDRFELYDRLAESLPAERDAYPETYQLPAINALAVLAGSREFFRRFLAHTSHSPDVTRAFTANAQAITRTLNRASQYHLGVGSVGIDAIQRQLRLLRSAEQRSVALLKRDVLRSGVEIRRPEGRRG